MPKVINLHGRGGAVPPGAVYIGDRMRRWACGLPKSKWANPFKIIRDGTRDEVIEKFERWLGEPEQANLMAALPELRGKDLACWCAPKACHGDVLLRLANR
jgi:hypothetical protein